MSSPEIPRTSEPQFAELVVATNPLREYAAALIPAAVVLLGALQVMLADDRIDTVEGGQLIALIAGIVVTYFVPIVDGRWAGLLKTGAAVVAAVATLIIPFVLGFTWQGAIIVALAVLQALATEIGVHVRDDTPAEAPPLYAAEG